MSLPEDIVSHVTASYGKRSAEVCAQLEELSAKLDLSSARVLRCILHLSKGDHEKLEYNTKCARTDWRDVIYWAEYDSADQRIHDFNTPFE